MTPPTHPCTDDAADAVPALPGHSAAVLPRHNALVLPADAPLVCDTSRRFVRVTERRADGLVAFEFSIGWPDLAVELLLPTAAFDEFCARNAVQHLDR